MKLAVGKMHLKHLLAGIADRLDHLCAELLRAQLPTIKDNISQWNVLHYTLAARMYAIKSVMIPSRRQEKLYVGSSIQFLAKELDRG